MIEGNLEEAMFWVKSEDGFKNYRSKHGKVSLHGETPRSHPMLLNSVNSSVYTDLVFIRRE